MEPVRTSSVQHRRVRPVDKKGKTKFWTPEKDEELKKAGAKLDDFDRSHGGRHRPTPSIPIAEESEDQGKGKDVQVYIAKFSAVPNGEQKDGAQKDDIVIIVDGFDARKQGGRLVSERPVRALKVHDFSGEFDLQAEPPAASMVDSTDPTKLAGWALQYIAKLKSGYNEGEESFRKTGRMPDHPKNIAKAKSSIASEPTEPAKEERRYEPTTFRKPEQAPHLDSPTRRTLNIIKRGYTDHVSPETQEEFNRLKKVKSRYNLQI